MRIPPTRFGISAPRPQRREHANLTGSDDERGEGSIASEGTKGNSKRLGKGNRILKGKENTEEQVYGYLKDQALEMVKLMRRSIMLHEGRERGMRDFDGEGEAERRVGWVEVGVDEKEDDGAWAVKFFEEVMEGR